MAASRFADHLLTGVHGARPAANAVPVNAVYACSTHALVYVSDGAAWTTWFTAGNAAGADMVASGVSHAHGLVPDPGASAGTTKYLREDGTWVAPPGGGLGTPSGTLLRSYAFATTVESWTTTAGTLTSTSAKLRLTHVSQATALEPVGAANVADGELQCEYRLVSGATTGILFRATDASNAYVLVLDAGAGAAGQAVILYKEVATVFTNLNPTQLPPISPVRSGSLTYKILIRFVGSKIDLFINEAYVFSWYDATYTTGRVGMIVDNSTTEMDDVKVYSVP